MEILGEGALDKALEGPENTLDRGKPVRYFMRSSMINTSKHQMLGFEKSFY